MRRCGGVVLSKTAGLEKKARDESRRQASSKNLVHVFLQAGAGGDL